MAISNDFFHQFINGDLFAAMRVPGITVMAVKAPHQATLKEGDEANTRAVNGATGFEGMDTTNSWLVSICYYRAFCFNILH